jgi:putative FmdB family regulatory protein
MALYAFRCPACGQEFEVSRKMSDSGNEATCPLDGTVSVRIFTVPNSPGDPFQRALRAVRSPSVWSHFGHSHDTGTAQHSH